MFIGGMTLSAVSCADDDLGENTNNGDKGAVVQFNVGDAQEEALTRGGAMTRGAITPNLTNKELDSHKLDVQGNGNLNVCLIETTVEGVNPVKTEPSTRANITTMSNLGNFSSTGLRSNNENTIGSSWFAEKTTAKDGTITPSIPWSWLQRYARFYAVYPETTNRNNKITVSSQPTATSAPIIEFEVNPDVAQQVDLMTACTGKVTYATQYQAPRSDLKFHHALTAIRFAVGQDLSFNKTIKKISINNVLTKSKYKLPYEPGDNTAGWDNTAFPNERHTVTLDGLNYKTNENPNSIIRNQTTYKNANERDLTKLNDGYTFYMIPQKLDGNNVTADIYFTDNTTIHVTLKGSWAGGK